jgi:hypothetical protein
VTHGSMPAYACHDTVPHGLPQAITALLLCWEVLLLSGPLLYLNTLPSKPRCSHNAPVASSTHSCKPGPFHVYGRRRFTRNATSSSIRLHASQQQM